MQAQDLLIELISFLLIASLFVGAPAWAQEEDPSLSTLGFLSWDYILIGRKIDSDETYTGRISFVYNEPHRCLDLRWTIAGQTVTGSARIASVLEGDAQVLRLSFWKKRVEYEGTFPDRPGLEANFIDLR